MEKFKVSDLPKSEQPQYRAQQNGFNHLSQSELLTLIIGNNDIRTANELLIKFKDINTIKNASVQQLKTVKGITESKAVKILSCFEIANRIEAKTDYYNPTVTSPDKVFQYLIRKTTDYYKENFFVCSLDRRNKIIALDQCSIGTLTASLVHPREVFEIAIKRHSASIIIAHNHPSGETDPSEDDLKVTKRIVDAGKIMLIDCIDHLIYTPDKYLSFKEKYLI